MAFGQKAQIVITPPKIEEVAYHIVGVTSYVTNKFSTEIAEMMAEKQAAGSTAKKGKRTAKDFDACAEASLHRDSEEGWPGIPATALRKALISACRLLGFPMTLAKLSIFVEADGYDRDRFNDVPLVRITKGKPVRRDSYVRNATGVADIRPRMHFAPGWEAVVRISYDADQFTLEQVTNLFTRVGIQVGIGAGRHDSSDSAGMGWGCFRIAK